MTNLFDGLNQARLTTIGQGIGLSLESTMGRRGSMELLLAYLMRPSQEQWARLAQTYALTWLTQGPQWIAPEAGSNVEERLRSAPERFLPGPMPQVGADAPVLTRVDWKSGLAAFVRSTKASLGKGEVDRILLRLFDEQDAREAPDFELNWRIFLHAWNLLQFHEGVEAISSEMIAHSTVYSIEQNGGDKVAETPDFEYGETNDEQLAQLLDLATGTSTPLILAVADAGLALPTDDFELTTAGAGCGPEPELAWPDIKVAVLSGRQAEDTAAFEAAGWTVLVQPVAIDSLIGALQQTSSPDDAGGQ